MKIFITERIEKQSFEIVGEIIGDILTKELANQQEIQCLKEKHTVFKERITSVDKTEEIVIIVLFDSSTLNYATQSEGQFKANYFIDIYASGKATDDTPGDEGVAAKVLRYAGMCRYILDSHKYITLGIEPSLRIIAGAAVQNIQMFEQENTQDASYSRMCRINFEVRIMEDQDVWKGILLDQHLTSTKLDLTEKGYQYKLI